MNKSSVSFFNHFFSSANSFRNVFLLAMSEIISSFITFTFLYSLTNQTQIESSKSNISVLLFIQASDKSVLLGIAHLPVLNYLL